MKFIARPLSRYQLVQRPVDVGLEDVRRIYQHRTYSELRSAACGEPSDHDPALRRIFRTLRVFRDTRDITNFEARFRVLAALAEALAKERPDEKLSGDLLRTRLAERGVGGHQQNGLWDDATYEDFWEDEEELRAVVVDLWHNVRNKLAHNIDDVWDLDGRLLGSPGEVLGQTSRDPIRDIQTMEGLVISMTHAALFEWLCDSIMGEVDGGGDGE